mmetsp:Transcript_32963/g.43419  ORF Transcript_32963/g.43419 Transcript_32963/m.43419 type:complete len:259 (+) Transcript_32963:560-1336(+)
MEACYYFNIYLLGEMNDPGNHLAWLEKTLREMQDNGEVAIMIGHHSPGFPDCLSEWSKRLEAILERYQDVVRLSFFGHIHLEMFNNVRGYESNRSFSVYHTSGALTTYSDIHEPALPSFRRFILDEETMLPIKIETYAMHIENENYEFELDHELTELYDIPDLSPKSFDQLSTRLGQDPDLAFVYERATRVFAPNKRTECDDECRLHLECTTRYAVHSDVRQCLGQNVDGGLLEAPWLKFATLVGSWHQDLSSKQSKI